MKKINKINVNHHLMNLTPQACFHELLSNGIQLSNDGVALPQIKILYKKVLDLEAHLSTWSKTMAMRFYLLKGYGNEAITCARCIEIVRHIGGIM